MIKRVAAIYSIIVGTSMLGMWTMFNSMDAIPELVTEPARILLHIAAEIATAVGLLVGGWGLLTHKRWGHQIYLLATGALVYTLIQSPGYFLQNGAIAFVAMFAVLLILALLLLVKMIATP